MTVLSFHKLGKDSYLLNVCISPSLLHLSLFEDGINRVDFLVTIERKYNEMHLDKKREFIGSHKMTRLDSRPRKYN